MAGTRTACGDMCESCALSLEAWPLASKDELKAKFASSAEFRREMLKVRAGVCIAKRSQSWRAQEVRSDKEVGLRISARASFVTTETFKAVEKCFPVDVKVPTMRLNGPDGEPLEGVMVREGSVPSGIPYYNLDFFHETSRLHGEWLMRTEEQQRESQGAERFSLACRNMQQSNMLARVKKLEPYSLYRKAAADHHDTRDLAMATESDGNDARRLPADVELERRSSLADETLMPPPPAKKGAKAGGGKGNHGRGFKSKAASKAGGKGRGHAVSVLSGSGARSAFSSVTSTAGGSTAGADSASKISDGDIVFGMDAGSESGSSAAGKSQEESFFTELQQVLAGEQLGRQMRKVPLLYSDWSV